MQFHIPRPCPERWENMTPTEKGAFCPICAKEVIDFTEMDIEEIKATLKSAGKVCGKFRDKQITASPTRKSRFALLWAGALLSLVACQKQRGLPTEASTNAQIKWQAHPQEATYKLTGALVGEQLESYAGNIRSILLIAPQFAQIAQVKTTQEGITFSLDVPQSCKKFAIVARLSRNSACYRFDFEGKNAREIAVTLHIPLNCYASGDILGETERIDH